MSGGGNGGGWKTSFWTKSSSEGGVNSASLPTESIEGVLSGAGVRGGQILDCSQLSFECILNSPKPNIISHLKIGDILEVSISTSPDIIIVRSNGNDVGTITGSSFLNLFNCMLNGYQYVSKIISITGGICRVHVMPK